MQAVSKRWGISGSSVRCPSSFTNLQVKKPMLVEGCWEDTSEFLNYFFPLIVCFQALVNSVLLFYDQWLWRATKKIWLKYLGYFQHSHLQCSSALLSHLSQIASVFTNPRCCPKSEESPDVHLCWDLHITSFWVSLYIFLSTVFFLCSCLCSSWAFCALYREANPASTLHYL